MAPRQVKEHWLLVAYKTSVMGLITIMVGAGLGVLVEFRGDIKMLIERIDNTKLATARLEVRTVSKFGEVCADTDRLFEITTRHEHQLRDTEIRLDKVEGK